MAACTAFVVINRLKINFNYHTYLPTYLLSGAADGPGHGKEKAPNKLVNNLLHQSKCCYCRKWCIRSIKSIVAHILWHACTFKRKSPPHPSPPTRLSSSLRQKNQVEYGKNTRRPSGPTHWWCEWISWTRDSCARAAISIAASRHLDCVGN